MIKYFILIVVLCTSFVLRSQSELIVNPGIKLVKDSIESKKLLEALNAFLNKAQRPNEENDLVLESEKAETYVLLDEVNGIQKSMKYQDSVFYKPYLTNVVRLSDKEYFIQVYYAGISETGSLLRAGFDFIAHKINGSFLFSSPLKENTKNWKVETAGDQSFYYENSLNKIKAAEYTRLVAEFDNKLKSAAKFTKMYCFQNLIHLQRMLGVTYKSDYNGSASGIWTASAGNDQIILLGNDNASFDHFDPHDLWHDRLTRVVKRSLVNKSVDEGCAYLYGGSWGLSWKEIFNAFKSQIASDRKTDWLAIKDNPVYFQTNEFKNNADNIVNALLVKKIEKENGFDAVWKLLNNSQQEKGNQKYFDTLEKITGITKENYNSQIWQLIDKEK